MEWSHRLKRVLLQTNGENIGITIGIYRCLPLVSPLGDAPFGCFATQPPESVKSRLRPEFPLIFPLFRFSYRELRKSWKSAGRSLKRRGQKWKLTSFKWKNSLLYHAIEKKPRSCFQNLSKVSSFGHQHFSDSRKNHWNRRSKTVERTVAKNENLGDQRTYSNNCLGLNSPL